MEQDFNRVVGDVCNVFKEYSGSSAEPRRDAGALIPFIRDFGWQTYDFRLLIEFHLTSEQELQYLSKPGNMNLRSIFHAARRDRLLDIHADLKKAKEIKAKILASEKQIPDIKINKIRLYDGRIFEQKFIKIPDPSVLKGYRWQSGNIEEYEKMHDGEIKCLNQLK